MGPSCPSALPVSSASLPLVSRDQEPGLWFFPLKVTSDTGHCPSALEQLEGRCSQRHRSLPGSREAMSRGCPCGAWLRLAGLRSRWVKASGMADSSAALPGRQPGGAGAEGGA